METLSLECGCVVPRTIIVCSQGQLYDQIRMPISEQVAIEILMATDEAVIKPTIGSSSGKGIDFGMEHKMQSNF